MAKKRGTLASKIPSRELSQALNKAASLMRAKQQHVMTVEMLLLAFVEMPDIEAQRQLGNFSRQRGFDWNAFAKKVDQLADRSVVRDVGFDFIADNRDRISLGDGVLTVLDEGLTLANSRNEAWCGTLHALAIMTTAGISTYRLLNKLGITKRAVVETMGHPSLSSGATTVDHVRLAKREQLTPVYARNDLLRNLMNLLSMTTGRHVILIGPTGVGKHSLVLALAQQIAASKESGVKSVVQMNEHALLDNAFTTLQAGLRIAKRGVLFIPDIVRFFGGPRRQAEFSDKAKSELQKALLGNDVAIIGTATEEQYTGQLSKNSVLMDHSQQFRVPPATVAETVEILNALQSTFQLDYNLAITPESLAETARLAGRYYTAEPMPGAAVHLLHRACAMFKVNIGTDDDQLVAQDNQLDVDDVMKATSMLTGIPMTNMGADERQRYMHMAEHLHKRIIGQTEPVQALSRAVKMARVGLKDPKRPIGSFLFLGPTGVGKSELAKALAEFMFGAEKALITLDMSEYMESSAVNRLIGSPPGYVGHDAGGQLTDAVKKQPYSVILFDEVEKADVKVFDTLLQVLDEGRLTSGKGETVSFRECVILMTSNIGGRYLADSELGEAFARDAAEDEVKKHFRPEFLNRLDDIIFFHLLSNDNLRDILGLLLRKEEKLLAGRDLKLTVSNAAKIWLLAQNDHPEWGARPLRRILQKHLREPMADFLLQEDPAPDTLIKVQKQGRNKLKFVQVKAK